MQTDPVVPTALVVNDADVAVEITAEGAVVDPVVGAHGSAGQLNMTLSPTHVPQTCNPEYAGADDEQLA